MGEGAGEGRQGRGREATQGWKGGRGGSWSDEGLSEEEEEEEEEGEEEEEEEA
jgi:hypothetical protein